METYKLVGYEVPRMDTSPTCLRRINDLLILVTEIILDDFP